MAPLSVTASINACTTAIGPPTTKPSELSDEWTITVSPGPRPRERRSRARVCRVLGLSVFAATLKTLDSAVIAPPASIPALGWPGESAFGSVF
jgi:hypothetical protein